MITHRIGDVEPFYSTWSAFQSQPPFQFFTGLPVKFLIAQMIRDGCSGILFG